MFLGQSSKNNANLECLKDGEDFLRDFFGECEGHLLVAGDRELGVVERFCFFEMEVFEALARGILVIAKLVDGLVMHLRADAIFLQGGEELFFLRKVGGGEQDGIEVVARAVGVVLVERGEVGIACKKLIIKASNLLSPLYEAGELFELRDAKGGLHLVHAEVKAIVDDIIVPEILLEHAVCADKLGALINL